MEKMQDYINFIFDEVWCKAKEQDYDIEVLFSGNEDLKQLIIELHTSAFKGADFFLTGLQLVFEDFKLLSDIELQSIKDWYSANNNIELACLADPSVTPVTYREVSVLSEYFAKHLSDFFKNLYSQSFLSLSSVSSRIGDIDNHYQTFMEKNKSGKCPFCGLNDLKGIYHSKREAYDHFLPKGKYPFNSINFRNLVPACHECNSTYKLSIDPLYATGGRRKAFYPYSNSMSYSIDLNVGINTQDWNQITPDNITLETGPTELREQLDTWLDVYGIEERYKAKLCGENDGKGWLREVIDESQNYEQTPEQFLIAKIKTATNSPWVDNNFLRKPFLEACQRNGLFS